MPRNIKILAIPSNNQHIDIRIHIRIGVSDDNGVGDGETVLFL